MAQPGQRIRFRTAVLIDESLLTALPEVTSVSRSGDLVTVTGSGDALSAVTAVLARNRIVAHQLRIEQIDE
jgi:ABC-2 type transport system ATP-binding protein